MGQIESFGQAASRYGIPFYETNASVGTWCGFERATPETKTAIGKVVAKLQEDKKQMDRYDQTCDSKPASDEPMYHSSRIKVNDLQLVYREDGLIGITRDDKTVHLTCAEMNRIQQIAHTLRNYEGEHLRDRRESLIANKKQSEEHFNRELKALDESDT